MKFILLLVFILASLAFSEKSPDDKYHLAFCATMHEIDYCYEHEALVEFSFFEKNIIVKKRNLLVYDLKILGQWVEDPVTGDRRIKVRYDDSDWTLTEREKSYILDNHHCATIEFWHGSWKSLRKFHGYVSVDLEDMLKFGDLCHSVYDRPPKKMKKKKYDSGKLIMGFLSN